MSKDEQVIGFSHRKMVSVQPVTRQIDYKACFGELLPEVVADLAFVFDNQEFHLRSAPRVRVLQRAVSQKGRVAIATYNAWAILPRR